MGVLKNGPNGGFSGKAGSVIGSRWKEIEYIRGLPKKRHKAPTASETKNRKRFALTQQLLNPLAGFFALGLMNFSGRMTAHNAVMSLNKNAIRFDGNELHVDYPSLILSYGNLATAESPVLSIVDRVISLKWKELSNRYSRRDDELLFVCYSPELGIALFDVGHTYRDSSKLEMVVPEGFVGQTVEAYMGFCSRDRKRASISIYLGQHIC